jgi:signal transduction histidine kinase
VQFEGPERLVFTGQPVGLKRLFDNLIDNGVKYGERVRIVLKSDDACVRVEVIDQGPGVAEAMREQIFKPFVRASQEHSGAGLGLASARAIARAHGGDVEVAATAPGPGAVFRVTLPL